MTLTDWLNELASLLAEWEGIDRALDAVERVYGRQVLVTQAHERVERTRDQVLARVEVLFGTWRPTLQ